MVWKLVRDWPLCRDVPISYCLDAANVGKVCLKYPKHTRGRAPNYAKTASYKSAELPKTRFYSSRNDSPRSGQMLLGWGIGGVVTQSSFSTLPLSQLIGNGLISDNTPPPTYVLVIDDERLIADTLVEILRMGGFAALAAYDGESALEMADLAPPEIVIADIGLPGMNGINVAIAIEESISDAKVLLLSAQADLAELNRARSRGHKLPLVTKPVSPDQLLRLVRDLANVETRQVEETGVQ